MLANRAKQTTTTQTDALPYSLQAAIPAGFVGFVAGMIDSVGGGGPWPVSYLVEDDADQWEVGFGTLTDAATDTVSRDTILGSSNGGAAVNWGSGTRTITIVLVAEQLAGLLNLATAGLIKRTGANAYAIVTISANGESLVGAANYAAMKALLDLEIGVDVQAWDADLDTIAGLAKTAGHIPRADGAAWLSVLLNAALVPYDPTTSGLAATNAQAAIDERIATLFRKTSDVSAEPSETVVAGLSNLAIPGTPNGSRKYRAVGQLLLDWSPSAGFPFGICRVRVGANGNVTDPIVWEGGAVGYGIRTHLPILVGEFAPSSGHKLSVTYFGDAASDELVCGDATVLESYIRIEMI